MKEKFIKQALRWKGKSEGDKSFRIIIDTYNSFKPLPRKYKVKYNDEWCATFVSAVAIKCGITDIIPPECSCIKLIENFKKLGVWVENENRKPKVGDIVFYDWQDTGKGNNKGQADHVGIVISVSRETFTVLEGNYNSCVQERKLKHNAKYLRGFAVPKYSKCSETLKSISEVAKDVINGKYGNGEERKKKLEKEGYNYNDVQRVVNKML